MTSWNIPPGYRVELVLDLVEALRKHRDPYLVLAEFSVPGLPDEEGDGGPLVHLQDDVDVFKARLRRATFDQLAPLADYLGIPMFGLAGGGKVAAPGAPVVDQTNRDLALRRLREVRGEIAELEVSELEGAVVWTLVIPSIDVAIGALELGDDLPQRWEERAPAVAEARGWLERAGGILKSSPSAFALVQLVERAYKLVSSIFG